MNPGSATEVDVEPGVEPVEQATEENRRLRRTMRDLVALSTLPAVWIGLAPEGIAGSLADVLRGTLSLDLIYIRLQGAGGEGAIELVRTDRPSGEVPETAVKQAIASMLESCRPDPPATIPDPLGPGVLHIAVTRFGVGDEQGVLVTGSRNPAYPTEQDRLLLGVGANQTAVVVQRRRAEERLHEQQEWLQVTLASIGDAVIATDTDGRVTFLNPVAEGLTGWNASDARGRRLTTVFRILNNQTGVAVENPVEKVLRDGSIVGLANHTVLIAKDGTERPIDDSAAPIRDVSGELIGVVLIFRDVTGTYRAEQHRNARLAVTQVLAQATSIPEAAAGVLQGLCENLGWGVGLFWSLDEEGSGLICRQSWCRPGTPLAEFERASVSRTFGRGEGLPGDVWATGKSRWLADAGGVPDLPRFASAAMLGLRSALACPVIVSDRTVGVIEFFSQGIREPDAGLLEMMTTVASHFGQFIERKTAEDELRQSEQELSDFFENATLGLHWVGPDGRILRANQVELEMLGYSREEYVGQPIAGFHADEAVISEILKRLGDGEKLKDHPARLRCKDGSIKEVLIDSSVLWRDGRFVHTRCFTRDVTERNRTEARLREQEQQNRLILESITDAFFAVDRHWRFTYLNRQAERLLFSKPGGLLGRVLWDEFPALLGTDFETAYRRAAAERVTLNVTAFFTDHGRWYEVHIYPTPENISVYFRDASERKIAEAALRQGEERLRLALEAGKMGVWDWDMRTGDFKWSDSLEPLHGLAPGTFGGTFEDFQSLHHPDDRGVVSAAIRKAVDEGSGYDIEVRNVRSDGAIHWIAAKGKVFAGDDGRPERMIGIGMDVTERKRTEERARFLADASASLAVLEDFDGTLQKVASLAVPFFADWVAVDLVEADGSLRRVAVAHVEPAKARLGHELHHQFPPDPNASQGAWTILRTGRAELVREISEETLLKSVQDEKQVRILRELGFQSSIGVPLKVRGKPIGVLTFVAAESGRRYEPRDLAAAEDLAGRAAIAIENARLYRELRDADRRKDEFIATLAHELRNPLAPIRNALEVLRLADSENDTGLKARAMMERQLNQMVRLVDDLLDVSRITRNKLDLRKERVELSAVIESAVETSRPLIDHGGHTLTITPPGFPVYLDADLTRLAQLFSNLLNNSAKYTDPGGRISMIAEVAGDEVSVRVRDNGVGIPAESLPRLFEMFSQVDRNLERAQGGLGIGLTLVRRLAELHGGTVEARSEGPGAGSEFTVRLPIVESPVGQGGATLAEDAGSAASSKRRILIVDDNHDAALSLGLMLELMGNETFSVHDGLDAVEAADRLRPDIILLDIGLPKLDGCEACRRIREQPWSAGMLIIALTGWGQDDDRRKSREAGFDHHFTKPVEVSVLQKLLAGHGGEGGRGLRQTSNAGL